MPVGQAKIERRDNGLVVSGSVTLETVPGLVKALSQWPAEACAVDLGGITESDSAALALLLHWQRTAAKSGCQLQFTAWPESLQSLLGLYDLEPVFPTGES
jgi:phospholipid transport system transporter-binding protein